MKLYTYQYLDIIILLFTTHTIRCCLNNISKQYTSSASINAALEFQDFQMHFDKRVDLACAHCKYIFLSSNKLVGLWQLPTTKNMLTVFDFNLLMEIPNDLKQIYIHLQGCDGNYFSKHAKLLSCFMFESFRTYLTVGTTYLFVMAS